MILSQTESNLPKKSKSQFLIFSSSIFLLLLFYSALISWVQTGSQFRRVYNAGPEILGVSIETTPIVSKSIYELPVRLKIPKIDIDANILQMGLTADGKMDVPETLDEVGWYKYGPIPGAVGNSVIDGHVGVGEKGVFMDLHKLEIGDYIYVQDKNDKVSSYIVTGTQIYDHLEHPEEVFFSNDGKAHLNLITCSGDWIRSIQGTQDRLVVFSDFVE